MLPDWLTAIPVYYNSTIDRNECECCEFLEIAEIIAALIQANSNSIQNEVRNKLLTSAIDYWLNYWI